MSFAPLRHEEVYILKGTSLRNLPVQAHRFPILNISAKSHHTMNLPTSIPPLTVSFIPLMSSTKFLICLWKLFCGIHLHSIKSASLSGYREKPIPAISPLRRIVKVGINQRNALELISRLYDRSIHRVADETRKVVLK
jgi:hypothetical protein